MRVSGYWLLIWLLAAFNAPEAAAQCVSLTNSGVPYTQNFNTLSSTSGGTTNNLSIPGWFLTEYGGGARDNEQYAVDTGLAPTGDTYSYGAAASSDRALGSVRSGTLIPAFGACFTNNTGSTITSLSIQYAGEEYRLGVAGRTDQLSFEYSTDASDLTTGVWISEAALNFVTPSTQAPTGAKTASAIVGPASISSLSIANGSTFWIRWTDVDASGADDGLAVDDFSLTPTTGGISTNPSATGSSTSVTAGSTTVFSGTITAGTNPTSVSYTAGCDLTSIGGGSSVTLDVSGVTISGSYAVPGGTAANSYTLPCTVTDDQSRAGNFDISLTVVPVGGSYTLTGPSGGAIGAQSTAFTVTPNAVYNGDITITPNGGGLSAPIVLTFSSAAAQTFTITPTAVGPVTLTPSNSGSLSNPTALMYATPSEAPLIGTATPGNGSATVTFSGPAVDGGSLVTGYTVDCGGHTETGASSPITVSGLTNGTVYTCAVTATNGAGTSAASAASNSVTPVAPANSFALTGPSGGAIGALSAAFTVTPSAFYNGAITITPNGGGLSAPIVLNFNSAAAQTFTITPTAVGPVTLTPTNNGSLANPQALTYATPSEAPVIGTATAGNGAATVSFTAPAANGGSLVTGYTVDCGGHTEAGSSSPITVSGLTNGTAYTCTVTATNGAGTSAASAASNPVTPVAPANSFTLTGPSGGAIGAQSTAFTVTPNAVYNGDITITPNGGGLSAPIVLNFNSATAQTFTITPTAVGPVTLTPTNSSSLANPQALTYATPSEAPVIGAATAGNGSATVAFSAPAANGGSLVTGYTVDCGGNTEAGASSPITVSGLTNGTAYTCTVTATNGAGTSAASAASNPVTPVAPANSFTLTGPSGGAIGAESTVFTVTPNAVYNGDITISPNGGGLSAPIVLNFNSATAQTFTITPTAVGPVTLTPSNSGSLSNPTALTYATPSEAAVIGMATAGNGSATVAFSAPAANGGSLVTGYTVDCGGQTEAGASSPITVSGLTNGTPYTCTVTATNDAGTSAASEASNSVTPVAPANSFTLTGPSGGAIGAQSTVFTVTPNAVYNGAITITPNGGGLSAPIVLNFNSATAQTFTITPTAVGPVTLTPSNSGSLSNPTALTYATPSGAPVIGTATAGNGSATVAFTAPAANGGSLVTGYTVDCGGHTSAGVSSPITVSGLTNGTAYTCTVTATNGAGTGAASAPSSTVTPAGRPGAPAIGSATGGNATATVSFTAPANNGAPITSYTVTATPGGQTASGSSSPITVSGLTNGVAYAFSVTATNSAGTGPASGVSNTVVPAGQPGAPTAAGATAGNAQATIYFTPPASNGGAAISSYTATATPGGRTASGSASPLTVTGLTNGVAYTFTVSATNSAGTGPSSTATNSVTPAGLPGAPTTASVTAGNAQATIHFAAPANDGGAAITSYTATATPGGRTASGSASPLTVTGLTNGVAYAFTVAATNSEGTGPASTPSNSVTPLGVPGAPEMGSATAGNASATVTFTSPVSNGGAPITRYTVTSNPGNLTASGASSPITLNGLVNGVSYTFTVTAANSAGTGAASAASNSVTPRGVPGAPAIESATGGNAQATIRFAAPASNGGAEIAGYTVTAIPGGRTVSGSASPLTVTGLTNGQAYTFTVTATNAVGAGPASAASGTVVPQAGPPGAPQNVAAIAGNAQARITFDPPATDGGSAISTYTVRSIPDGLTASGSGSPLIVAGLTNGTTYTFTVWASNGAGAGPTSAASNSVTPQSGVPGAPQQVQAAAGDSQATVSFIPPADSDSSQIFSYTVSSSPGGRSASGPASPLTVPGLTNGTAYVFTVTATNAAGTGAASAPSNTVTPAGPLAVDLQSAFPAGMVGLDYPLQILAASGGVAPYTFAITSGKLPDGLAFSSPEFSGIPTAAGDFGFTITVTDASGNSASGSASITIKPAHAGLIISQSVIQFALTSGSNDVPSPASVTVRSSVIEQLLNYTVTVSPSVPWLEVAGGGTTPGSIGIVLAPSALTLGPAGAPYQTTISVACVAPSPCAGDVETISVSLNVTAPPPRLSVTRGLLSFEALSSSPAPASWPLGIQNSGGGTLLIESVTTGDNWLSVSGVPTAILAGPAVPVTVTANPEGLSDGYHRSTITISSAAGSVSVPVSLLISSSQRMILAPAGAQFEASSGSAPGSTRGSFRVSVSGNSTVAWTASVLPGSSWLSVDAPSGTASSATPGTVSFSISPELSAGLTPKTYYGTIRVTSDDVINSPMDFGVVLNVTPATAPVRPHPFPAGLVFVATVADGSPSPQDVQVYASSKSAIPYQASAATNDATSWLSVSPSTGSASSSVPGRSSVSVNTAGLAPGVYTGGVSYAFTSAAVRTVNVTLVVVGRTARKSSGRSTALAAQAECVPSKLVPTQIGLVDNFEQRVGWPTPVSVIVLDDCATLVTSGQMVASFSNGDPPLTLTPLDDSSAVFSGTWTPRSVSAQATVTVTTTASDSRTASTQITGQVAAGTAPVLAANGTLHAFSRQVGGALSPGTIVEIYGSNLAAGIAQASSTPLATTLAGSSVLVGGIAAPLFYAAPGQINAQIPFELIPGRQYQVQVDAGGTLSTPELIQLAPVSPGIGTLASGTVIAQRYPDYSLVSADAPARPGDLLTIYLTGLGATERPVATGAASPVDVLVHPAAAPTLTLNGNAVPIDFAGLTPGSVGLFQINFRVPESAPAGNLKLVVSQAGSETNTVVLPVKP